MSPTITSASARAVAIAHQGAAKPAGGAQGNQRAGGAAGAESAKFGKTVEESAGGTATYERAAPGKSQAAFRADETGGVQEQGSRAGKSCARGKGRAACALLSLQIRVPGQHVARAAHAVEQPANPRETARGQPRQQSHPATDR